jgi:hypothetical protein
LLQVTVIWFAAEAVAVPTIGAAGAVQGRGAAVAQFEGGAPQASVPVGWAMIW